MGTVKTLEKFKINKHKVSLQLKSLFKNIFKTNVNNKICFSEKNDVSLNNNSSIKSYT